MNLAAKIMQHRKRLGLSQEKLAEQLGVSRQAITRWEAGQSLPELEKVVRLSELFAVSCDELLKDEPTPPEPAPSVPAPIQPAPLVLASWFWMRLGGALLLLVGVADVLVFWVLSQVNPVDIFDWDGTRLYGLSGYLRANELCPVFCLFIGLGLIGAMLLIWSILLRRRDLSKQDEK